jgi:mycothiol synthase
VPERLTEEDRDAVLELVRTAAAAGGPSPVSEDGRLALAHGRPGAVHLLWREPSSGPEDGSGALAGYLYLSPADAAGDRTAEVGVVPASRGRGIGRALVGAALAETAGMLRIWAHGSAPAAAGLAARLDFAAVRELRLLELGLDMRTCGMAPVAGMRREFFVPPLPEGVELRTFQVGRDEPAWLALNARAFAHHPEQGAWTARDLAEREAEPWFDPAGFFLAVSRTAPTEGGLLGFHWTKVHPAGAYGPDEVGEIYVLGVDPTEHGRGLGRLLALAGLRHLAQSGMNTIILYVDGDNAPAVRLYESLGFRSRTVDALYERRGTG